MKNKSIKKEIDGFVKICNEIIELKKKKANDYGNSWRAFGIKGLYYQLGRKFARIWLNKDNSNFKNESLRDSLIDNAVYSLMAIQLLDENDTEDKIDEILK